MSNDIRRFTSRQSYMKLMNGITLHYLDWGGLGDPLVLLHGLGDSAHIFGKFAPTFSDRYRVIALTRRGHGQSDRPAYGYDLPSLVDDILQFCDAHHLEQITFIGHSFAGAELSYIARTAPQRVEALVYLDASADHARLASQPITVPLKPIPPS